MTILQNANPKTRGVMSQYASRLSRADPEAWEQFLVAFELYSIEAMEALAGAPQDQILNMQGRAQQLQALLRLYRECNKKQSPAPAQAAPAP
jgi:hypothetical protein